MNPSTTLARAVVDALIAAGVEHVVLAPGSRSAPLAYAVLAAERAGRLTLHVRIDERTAGFLALGLAKVSRVPAALVTTSGTAVANLHPAVLEAHHGLVPLIVLSADRPVEMRGIGASQTTIQPGMFGESVRFEVDLDADRGDAASWRRQVAGAVVAARGADAPARAREHPPGPVHVNVGFREPLVPDLLDLPDGDGGGVEEVSRRIPDPAAEDGPTIPQFPTPLNLPDRTLVIIGDLPEPGQARQVAAWAARHGWPVIAEPFGDQPLSAHVLPHCPLLLGTSWFADHRPERIVAAGRITLSRPVRAALTAAAERVTYLAAGPRWLGPSYPVADTVDLDTALTGFVRPGGPPRTAWLRTWHQAAGAVRAALAEGLPWGSGVALARSVVAALPSGAQLVVGSSNPVRDLEIAVDWSTAPAVRVVANRGLAGIDGMLSTAAGIALAGAAPTYALVGDLTFLHDSNALLIGPDEPRPDLSIIVANDDGGGIFTTLEPGEPQRAEDFERTFGTPTRARIEDLARAYSIPHVRVESAADLAGAVQQPPQGLRIIEVPIDRSGHRALRERLFRLADDATAGVPDAPVPSPGLPDRDYPERGMRL